MLQFLTTDAFPWVAFYFIGMLIVSALAWASRDPIKGRLAFVLFLAWMSENVLKNHTPYPPPWIAAADLALLALVLFAGRRERSWTAFWVAAFFALDESILWGHVYAGRTPNGVLYAALNAMYLSQLLIVGVASARMAFGLVNLHWLSRHRVGADRAVRG